MARLSVNLNKIALLRNSRRTGVPDLLRFARLALDAAMKSKFTPADPPRNRQWLLRFEFARSGVTGDATPGS